MLTLLFDAGYVTIVVVGTLKSAFSFFISAVVHELRLVQELTRTLNPAVRYTKSNVSSTAYTTANE